MSCILVVDDEPAVQAAVARMLEGDAMEILYADGEGAVRALRSHRVDLVLCDLFMPGFDGIDLIRLLRREFPDVKILAMSGGGFLGAVDLLPAARQMGAGEILYKPLERESLLAAIARALA